MENNTVLDEQIREQKLAALGSCVTIRIVRPRLRLISCNFSMSKRADFVSNAPVGSSAKIISGSESNYVQQLRVVFDRPTFVTEI